MALQYDEDLLCGGCGQPRDESMHPSAEGKYKARPLTCHACAEKSKAHADLAENVEHGLHLAVERIKDGGPRP